jgi:ribosome recycling factor
MDLRDLASINTPEPRLLVVQVWDQANIHNIEKAIRDAGQGFSPITESNLIRVPVPALTEERRKEMTKLVGEKAEAARVAIRQIRREAVEEVDRAQKSKQISEDEKFRSTDQIQKATQEFSSQVDNLAKMKENEILQI